MNRTESPPFAHPVATDGPSPEASQKGEQSAASSTSVTSTSRPSPPVRDHSPIRLLLTTAIVLLCLFLVMRTVAIEPFGVPTGSMAPALIGNHREGLCPRCGYPVKVGFPPAGGSFVEQYRSVACPNCGQLFSLLDERDISGDRLLVDKNVFGLRRPRRWEMAVFRCPDTDPRERGKPYVKRVVGLPGEVVRLLDGEVYVNDELMRKDLAELRETRVVVMDMSYVPKHGGWNNYWLMEPPENDPRLPHASERPLRIVDASIVNEDEIVLDASSPDHPIAGVRYRQWDSEQQQEAIVRAWSSYDGAPRDSKNLPPVHDFSVAFDLEVTSAGGNAVFDCGLSDSSDTVVAEIPVGQALQQLSLTQEGKGGLGSARGISLEVGKAYHVEYAFVDRRVLLALNGKQVLPAADLPPVWNRGKVRFPLQLRARGCRLVVQHFFLYRDVYYTKFGEHGIEHAAILGKDEYFVLGDNSGNSQDSRKWPSPAVPGSDFIGKPFLIHQPLRSTRMTLGGQQREIQTLDWSRLRWIH